MKKNCLIKIVGLLFVFESFFACYLYALNTSADFDKLVKKRWTVENGLPINSITSITQTDDNFIWVGYLGGVSKFDGIIFRKIKKTKNIQVKFLYTFKGNFVFIGEKEKFVIVSSDGKLLLEKNFCLKSVTKKNKFLYILSCNKKLFTLYYSKNKKNFLIKKIRGIESEIISKNSKNAVLAVDNENKIYEINEKGVNFIIKFKKYSIITSILTDKKKRIWIGTSKALYLLKKNKGDYESAKKIISSKIFDIFEDREGNIFVSTIDGGG